MSLTLAANPTYDGSYLVQVAVVPATTLAAGTTYFALRNNTTGKRLFIKKISLMTSFTGTAAASLSRFDLVRFSAATPTGGTALTVAKGATSYPASNVLDARFNASGLATTGVTFEASVLASLAQANQLNAIGDLDMRMNEASEVDDIVLGPGEGIAIRAGTALVAGISVHGFVQWAERV